MMDTPLTPSTTDDLHTDRADDGADEHALGALVHEGDVVMLTTAGQAVAGRLSSRPLTVAAVGEGTLLFLVDGTAEWVAALAPDEEVNASVATRRNDWVSITGAATVSHDPGAIAQLWSPAAGAYFDGVEDPRLRVLQLHMEVGEYWSAPGAGPLGRLVALVSAAIGSDTGSGDRGRVTP